MKRLIGIAVDPQEQAWIEKWQHENKDQVDVVKTIFAGLVKRPFMLEYMEDARLLDSDVDGFVFDTFRMDNQTVNYIHQELAARGFEMYSARGETSRRNWKA